MIPEFCRFPECTNGCTDLDAFRHCTECSLKPRPNYGEILRLYRKYSVGPEPLWQVLSELGESLKRSSPVTDASGALPAAIPILYTNALSIRGVKTRGTATTICAFHRSAPIATAMVTSTSTRTCRT